MYCTCNVDTISLNATPDTTFWTDNDNDAIDDDNSNNDCIINTTTTNHDNNVNENVKFAQTLRRQYYIINKNLIRKDETTINCSETHIKSSSATSSVSSHCCYYGELEGLVKTKQL